MGKNVATNSGLADALFSSAQQRVLGLLFGSSKQEYSTSEIIREVGAGSGVVQRELQRLAASGLIIANKVGNQKRYHANRASPIFKDLRGLILKTVGLVGPLLAALAHNAKRIKVAFVYGSTARGSDTSRSDIDLMVLGDDIAYADVFAALQKAEKTLKRTISPNLMTPAEWKRKIHGKNSFAMRINEQPKLFIVGTQDDLSGP